MKGIKLSGASFNTDFVRGFKKPEAFIKEMDGKIPDWVGEERNKLLKDVWNQANGKTEEPAPVTEVIPTAEKE